MQSFSEVPLPVCCALRIRKWRLSDATGEAAMTWKRSEARFQSHSPAHVLLDVQRQQLLGNAEGQRALFHLLSHKHPLVVHRLEPVDFAHWVLEHCEGQREQKVCVK